jgi:hypothetical protein
MSKDKKEKRIPAVGEFFYHRYMGVVYELKVVETEGGIGYELEGVIYKSPTAAAKALVGPHQPTNGRSFWHID